MWSLTKGLAYSCPCSHFVMFSNWRSELRADVCPVGCLPVCMRQPASVWMTMASPSTKSSALQPPIKAPKLSAARTRFLLPPHASRPAAASELQGEFRSPHVGGTNVFDVRWGEPNYPLTDVAGLMTSGVTCKLEGPPEKIQPAWWMETKRKRVSWRLNIWESSEVQPLESERVSVNLLRGEPPPSCNWH